MLNKLRNRLAKKLQMRENGITARLCACRYAVDEADGAFFDSLDSLILRLFLSIWR